MEEKNEKKSVWGIILKVIIVVATAIGSAFGVTACTSATSATITTSHATAGYIPAGRSPWRGRTASVTTATASASATKGDWTAKASRETLARLPRRLPSRSCCKSWAATSRQLSP